MRILIADDSSVVRMALRKSLMTSRPEATIDECADGVALRQRLLDTQYDIVFTDVHMPRLSGPDAIAAAKNLMPDTKIFSVFLSSDMSRDVLWVAERVGAFEFLQKPFRDNELREVMDAIDRVRKPAHILLVDDSRTVRKVIERVFQRSIFSIVTEEAADGMTALHMARQNVYDVVFLDVHMPDLDGFQTLALLRQFNRKAQVVLISGEERESVMLKAGDLDIASYLPKPFLPRDVDLVLYRLFGLKAPQLALIKAASAN